MTCCLLQVSGWSCWFLVDLYPDNSRTKVHCLLCLLSEVVLGPEFLGVVYFLLMGVV